MAHKHLRRLRIAGPSLLAAGIFGLLAVAAQAAGPAEYDVRSMVVDPKAPGIHGRVYAILSVQTVSSDPQNMPSVDEDSLITLVCHNLNLHGFRPVTKGQNPEILITVHYGRAWLRNPYLNDTGDSQAIEGFSALPPVHDPTQNITGTPTRLMDDLSRSHEAKVQKASAEKLYIRITGWQYPVDPKAKALMLWKTTMLVDDPDSWNLNAVAGGMLTAGSPYFAQQISEKELEIRPPMPEGHVKVGAAHVVDVAPARTPPTVTPPAPVEGRPPVVGKKFDLPASDAVTALQVFSRQSGEEIIYPVEQIRDIKTNAVRGEMSPRAALDRMLDGTGLSAVQDEKSDALAVRPTPRR